MRIIYFELPIYLYDPESHEDEKLAIDRGRVIRQATFMLNRVAGFYESYENPDETIIEFIGGDMAVSPKRYHEVKQILGIEPPEGMKPTIRLNLN